jgi:hypothetical protein
LNLKETSKPEFFIFSFISDFQVTSSVAILKFGMEEDLPKISHHYCIIFICQFGANRMSKYVAKTREKNSKDSHGL